MASNDAHQHRSKGYHISTRTFKASKHPHFPLVAPQYYGRRLRSDAFSRIAAPV